MKTSYNNFLHFLPLIVAVVAGARLVSSQENVTCSQVDCADGDYLVFTIRDCKLRAGLWSMSGDLRESTLLKPRQWAQDIAGHLENGCNNRVIQVAETHCVELPYTVCRCSENDIATVRKIAQTYKNCDKSLGETILLAISRMPLRVDWEGAAIFKPPEPRTDTDAVSFCINEATLESRQAYCEGQEAAIVAKLLSAQAETLELFFEAKRKAAIALISCLRTGLERFSHCPGDVVSAYLTAYYELAIAPGVIVPNNFLNSSFIPMPSQKRSVIGAVTTRHLLISDRAQPLLCGITEVSVLLLTNDYVDLIGLTQRFSDTPKFIQFVVSFYRPESPHSPIITVVIQLNDVRIHYTIDPHVAAELIEIQDTWKTEKMLTITDLQSASSFIFQRNDPDYLNVLILLPTSILDHSTGYLVSGCNQQSLDLKDENDNFREENLSPLHISECDSICRAATEWSQNCFYDCLLYNDTKAAENVITVHQSFMRLFPSASPALDDPVTELSLPSSQTTSPATRSGLIISSAFTLKFDSVLIIPLLSLILRF